mmetsp:Transcript_25206/g.42523  ORF Transcript_25206/g.42523 Transcript_25206/m.42523 type:complete len:262 (+) Transcript_25206:4388-5173(+)
MIPESCKGLPCRSRYVILETGFARIDVTSTLTPFGPKSFQDKSIEDRVVLLPTLVNRLTPPLASILAVVSSIDCERCFRKGRFGDEVQELDGLLTVEASLRINTMSTISSTISLKMLSCPSSSPSPSLPNFLFPILSSSLSSSLDKTVTSMAIRREECEASSAGKLCSTPPNKLFPCKSITINFSFSRNTSATCLAPSLPMSFSASLMVRTFVFTCSARIRAAKPVTSYVPSPIESRPHMSLQDRHMNLRPLLTYNAEARY